MKKENDTVSRSKSSLSANGLRSDGKMDKNKGKSNKNKNKKNLDEGVQLAPPSDDTVDITSLIPKPPDGGWGWVVVFASFFQQFILDGIGFTMGLFLKEYIQYFNCSATLGGAILSSFFGCSLISAPIVSALINLYGCRVVGIAGSLLSAFAFISSTFSPTAEVMMILFGILGGTGSCIQYMAAVLSPSMYFEKKRSIAFGIAMCGAGAGTVVLSLTSKLLVEEMDWKSAHFILAGLLLNGVVLSALVRPLRASKLSVKKFEESLKKSDCLSTTQLKDSLELIADKLKQIDGQVIPPPRSDYMMSQNVAAIRSGIKVYWSINSKMNSQHRFSTMMSTEEVEDLRRPMYRKDIFYSGSVYNLPEYRESQNIQEFSASMLTIPALQEHSTKSSSAFGCLPRQFADVLADMLNIKLFCNPQFCVIAVINFLAFFVYLIPIVFTIPRATSLGIDSFRSSLLITFFGAGVFVGRPLANGLAQLLCLKPLYVYIAALLLAGVSCLIVPYCSSYNLLVVSISCYGIFIGGYASLTPIVLADTLGLNNLTSAFGLLALLRGASMAAGPPVAGKMYDMFGGYDIPFYMSGGVLMFCAVGMCAVDMRCLKKTQHSSTFAV